MLTAPALSFPIPPLPPLLLCSSLRSTLVHHSLNPPLLLPRWSLLRCLLLLPFPPLALLAFPLLSSSPFIATPVLFSFPQLPNVPLLLSPYVFPHLHSHSLFSFSIPSCSFTFIFYSTPHPSLSPSPSFPLLFCSTLSPTLVHPSLYPLPLLLHVLSSRAYCFCPLLPYPSPSFNSYSFLPCALHLSTPPLALPFLPLVFSPSMLTAPALSSLDPSLPSTPILFFLVLYTSSPPLALPFFTLMPSLLVLIAPALSSLSPPLLSTPILPLPPLLSSAPSLNHPMSHYCFLPISFPISHLILLCPSASPVLSHSPFTPLLTPLFHHYYSLPSFKSYPFLFSSLFFPSLLSPALNSHPALFSTSLSSNSFLLPTLVFPSALTFFPSLSSPRPNHPTALPLLLCFSSLSSPLLSSFVLAPCSLFLFPFTSLLSTSLDIFSPIFITFNSPLHTFILF